MCEQRAFTKPIVLIGPMESETAVLIGALDDVHKRKIGAYLFYEGFINSCPVVVCRCYIGVVNSAAATTLAIQRYQPLCVIIQGTSGAHNPDLHQGDIVLGRRIVEIGSHYTAHRDVGQGSNYLDWKQPGAEVFCRGKAERIKELHSDNHILNLAQSIPNPHGRVISGTIGSADIWNRELDMIAHLHKTIGTDCEEMEGFGVAQVCAQLSVPCADIRVISNSEWYPQEEFNEIYGEYCQMFVLDIVRRLIAEKPLM